MSDECAVWLKEILSALDDKDNQRLAWAIQMTRNHLGDIEFVIDKSPQICESTKVENERGSDMITKAISKIAALTDCNDHNGAMTYGLYLLSMIADHDSKEDETLFGLIDAMENLVAEYWKSNCMTPKLQTTRDAIRTEMFEVAKVLLSAEDYDAFYMAY